MTAPSGGDAGQEPRTSLHLDWRTAPPELWSNRFGACEEADVKKVGTALSALHEGERQRAFAILAEIVTNAPDTYVWSYQEENGLYVKLWDLHEFMALVAGHRNHRFEAEGDIMWVPSAYPRAFYHMAFMAVEARNHDLAMHCLNEALAMEPDQPLLYCEMALVHSRTGDHERALELYDQSLTMRRGFAPPGVRARAMRGRGVELIELHRLHEAEQSLRDSLRLDPESEIAQNELTYIERLRQGGRAAPLDIKRTDGSDSDENRL